MQLHGPSFPETDKLFHLTYIWLTEGYRLQESLQDKFSILEPVRGALIPWLLSSGWEQHIKEQEQREQNRKRSGPAAFWVSPLWKGWSRAYYTKTLVLDHIDQDHNDPHRWHLTKINVSSKRVCHTIRGIKDITTSSTILSGNSDILHASVSHSALS